MTDSRRELVERVIEACARVCEERYQCGDITLQKLSWQSAFDIRSLDLSQFDEPAAPQIQPEREEGASATSAVSGHDSAVAAAPARQMETPRTDAIPFTNNPLRQINELYALARTLGRELAALREECDRLTKGTWSKELAKAHRARLAAEARLAQKESK